MKTLKNNRKELHFQTYHTFKTSRQQQPGHKAPGKYSWPDTWLRGGKEMHIRINIKIQHEPCSLRADFFIMQEKWDFFAGGMKAGDDICCDTEQSQKSHHLHQER